MRTHHICPKCGGHRILLVPDVVHGSMDRSTGEPQEAFEAYVCEECQYTELYASQPIVADGERIMLISANEPASFDEEDPDTADYFGTDWSGDDYDISEISRVEKKPNISFGTKVIIVHVGPRPDAVLGVLRDSLGLPIESEEELRKSLPYVVMDLITVDAARTLQQLLEDAGATTELHSKTDV